MKPFDFNAAWGYDCPDNYERLKRYEALAAEIELTDAERRWLNLQEQ